MTVRLITRMLTSAVFRSSVKESEAQSVQRQKVMPLISKGISKFLLQQMRLKEYYSSVLLQICRFVFLPREL